MITFPGLFRSSRKGQMLPPMLGGPNDCQYLYLFKSRPAVLDQKKYPKFQLLLHPLLVHSKRKYYLLVSCLLLLGSYQVWAQEAVEAGTFYSSLKTKQVSVSRSDTLYIDSLAILPGSFSIYEMPDSSFVLFPEGGFLVWNHRPWLARVTLRNRVLALSFTESSEDKKSDLIECSTAFEVFKSSDLDTFALSDLAYSHIDYSGSYGRSMSVGNQQDV